MITIKKTIRITMHYCIATLLVVISGTSSIFAQNTKEDDKPVAETFNSGVFLENQTVATYGAKVLEFIINHRFGKISDGGQMAFGIYSPSNIRLALDYGILDDLQIGLGATKNDKLVDGNIKWTFYKQSKSGKRPFTLSYYGNLVFRGDPTSKFANPGFKEAHRLSYFHELLIARKFCSYFSLQVAPIFTHYNLVETASPLVSSTGDTTAVPVRGNDNFGLSALAKLNIKPALAVLCEYDMNFSKLKISETDVLKNPKPVIALGIEMSTPAHAFQIFVSTGDAIVNQKNMVYNQNSLLKNGDIKSGLVIGFNITRVFY